MKRNLFNLKNFAINYKPKLIFLSEPQLFQSDLPTIMKYFQGEYSVSLNSEDLHNPELSLTTSRAKGGTMVMWQKHLDPYVTVNVPDSSSFLPIVIEIPGFTTMIHVALYLPTAGKETEFLDELANMKTALGELRAKFPSAAIFLRGDCNASSSNSKRHQIFSTFVNDLNLNRVKLHHNSYHHFLGMGSSDSELDVILFSNEPDINEDLNTIVCKLDDPSVDSHHDLLISTLSVPSVNLEALDKSRNVVAPKLPNTRHKIIWNIY